MAKVFAEVLRPVVARLPKVIREHEIMRISLTIFSTQNTHALQNTRNEVLKWVQKRSGTRLPDEAWNCLDFESLSGGRNSAGIRISNEQSDIWSIRADDPDKNIAGRTWTTEVTIGGMHGQPPRLSLRLLASTYEDELLIDHHAPGIVQQIVEGNRLLAGGYEVTLLPQYIDTDNDADELVEMLADTERKLPVLVLTIPSNGQHPLINAEELSKAVLGLAHVVVLPSHHAWKITDKFGRHRSVFGGAVRAYLPGFDISSSPYEHRLIIADQMQTEDDIKKCSRWMRALAANESVKRHRIGKDVLPFSQIRNASFSHRQKELEDEGADDSEQLLLARKHIEALERQIADNEKTIEYFESEHRQAEERAESAEADARATSSRIQYLIEQQKEMGRANDNISLPESWEDLGTWCDKNLAGQVILHPRARRGIRNPEFEEVATVARCLLWLATDCRSRRINGGSGTLREEQIEDGIKNAHCGSDQYDVSWQGRSYTADWHIKNGGNTRDPRRCLRIYYFWDEATQLIVVTDMPAHRATDAS